MSLFVSVYSQDSGLYVGKESLKTFYDGRWNKLVYDINGCL